MRHESSTENPAKRPYRSFSADESGQDMVEYVLLAALIGSGIIVAWNYILSSSAQTPLLTIAKQLLMIMAS